MKHKINHIKLDIMDLLDELLIRWGLTQEGQGYDSIEYYEVSNKFSIEVDGDTFIINGDDILGIIFGVKEDITIKSFTNHSIRQVLGE